MSEKYQVTSCFIQNEELNMNENEIRSYVGAEFGKIEELPLVRAIYKGDGTVILIEPDETMLEDE